MRPWVSFERTLGNYFLAGAQYSYGDVIALVEREKQGIVLVDTVGKRAAYRREMKVFLERTIQQGWGQGKDALEDLLVLEDKIEKATAVPDNWNGDVSALYMRISNEIFSMAKAGGIPNPLRFRVDGTSEDMDLGARAAINHLGSRFRKKSALLYQGVIADGDLLLLYSDGLYYLLIESANQKQDLVFKEKRASACEYARHFINRNRHRSLVELRDAFLNEIKKRLGDSEPGDDITFSLYQMT